MAITLYTREWPQTNLQLIELHICDLFYLGSLWRDWARAVCRAVGTTSVNWCNRTSGSLLRHLPCRRWRPCGLVEERLRASIRARLRRAEPVAPVHACDGEEAVRSPWLRADLHLKMVRDEIKARFTSPTIACR